ncbi:hypothetical protein ONZ45_g7098 [Pleurotus djamor]|nr:hypothetical protein ONZ45_g7098 [Pleurotus djamor]
MSYTLASPGLSLYSIPIILFVGLYPGAIKVTLIDKTIGYDKSNVQKAKTSKGLPPDVVLRIERLEGAHQNGNEAFPLWAAAIILANVVGLEPRTLNIASLAYVGFRVLYNHVYVNHNTVMKGYARRVGLRMLREFSVELMTTYRSMVFLCGFVIPIYLLVQSAAKASAA